MARKTPKEGPYIATARAKKMPGKTVRVGGIQLIKAKGKKPIGFRKGGLHATLGMPSTEKIPASKMAAALAGKYGIRGKKQALMAKNLLAKGRATAAAGRARRTGARKMRVFTPKRI